MKLLIEAKGGIAGDMFSAAFISAGTDINKIINAMTQAANKIGTATITMKKAIDNACQLIIQLSSNDHHLSGQTAEEILTELFNELQIKKKYQIFGKKILATLLDAEQKAHKKYHIEMNEHHTHRSHPYQHDQKKSSQKNHSRNKITLLHEAQDIVIDIIGAVVGMQDFNLDTGAKLLSHVSVGGGRIEFSHGKFTIPAPATETILTEYNIKWQKGPIDVELCTPTGAAILAALNIEYLNSSEFKKYQVISSGISRGNKYYQIPPLKIYICQN